MSPVRPPEPPNRFDRGLVFTVDSIIQLPLVKLAAAAVALLSMGWAARSYLADIKSSVDNVAVEIGRMRVEFREELDRRTSDRWSRTDQRFWVYELDKANGGKMNIPAIPSESYSDKKTGGK